VGTANWTMLTQVMKMQVAERDKLLKGARNDNCQVQNCLFSIIHVQSKFVSCLWKLDTSFSFFQILSYYVLSSCYFQILLLMVFNKMFSPVLILFLIGTVITEFSTHALMLNFHIVVFAQIPYFLHYDIFHFSSSVFSNRLLLVCLYSM